MHFTAGLTTKRALCEMTQKWPQLTNHDSSKALRGVKGALSPAIFSSTIQREVSEVLKEEIQFQLKGVYVNLCIVMFPVKEGLSINLPSSHTEVERRVCRRHTAAHRPRLEALECSLDSPSGMKHLINDWKYTDTFYCRHLSQERDILTGYRWDKQNINMLIIN